MKMYIGLTCFDNQLNNNGLVISFNKVHPDITKNARLIAAISLERFYFAIITHTVLHYELVVVMSNQHRQAVNIQV